MIAKRTIWLAVGAVVAVALGALLLRVPLNRGYEKVFAAYSISRAQEDAQQGKHSRALHRLANARKRFPNNLELMEAAADYFEVYLSPGAIGLRERILTLSPDRHEAGWNLVQTLLTFQRTSRARSVLEAMGDSDTKSPRELHLWGTLSFQEKEFEKAADLFSRAAASEPHEARHRVNALLAEIQLGGARAAQAARELTVYADDERYEVAVAAAQVQRALEDGEPGASVATAFAKLGNSVSIRSPHFRTYLRALGQWKPEDLTRVLGDLWTVSGVDVGAAVEQLRWLRGVAGPVPLQRSWHYVVSPRIQVKELVLLEAEICVEVGEERQLRECLEKLAWEEMPVLRWTFEMWLQRERIDARRISLQTLLRYADEDQDGLLFSAMFLRKWGLADEALGVWSVLAASRHPAWGIGLAAAAGTYRARGDLREELKFYRKVYRTHPLERRVLARRIYLELVLGNRSIDLQELARQLEAASPGRPEAQALQAWAYMEAGKLGRAADLAENIEITDSSGSIPRLAIAMALREWDPKRAKALGLGLQNAFTTEEERSLVGMLSNLPLSPEDESEHQGE